MKPAAGGRGLVAVVMTVALCGLCPTAPAGAADSTTTTQAPATVPSRQAPTNDQTSATPAPPPPVEAPAPVDDPNEDASEAPPPRRPVPPRTSPRVQTPVDSAVSQAVSQQVKTAQDTAKQALAASQAADRQLAQFQAEQAALQKRYDNLAASEAQAAARLQHHRDMVKTRAIAIYITGPADPVVPAGQDAYEYGRSRMLLKSLHDADVRALNAFRDAKNAAGSEVTKMVDELERFNAKVSQAQEIARQARDAADAAESGLSTARASGTIAINGFVFPVGEPHNFTDTFGAPRSGGRTHKGADIFAPYGTPLFACERGVITSMGVNRLGGIKLWLIGESGTTYFYAHLSAYADGIVDGTLVEAGTLVGYVGNTGNAISTPPHLHFEIHPMDGPAINPTYILRTVDDATRAYRNQMMAAGQPLPAAGPAVPVGSPPPAASAAGSSP